MKLGAKLPSLNSPGWNTAANILVGIGDGVSMGATRNFRDAYDLNNIDVGEENLSYRLGNLGGTGILMTVGGSYYLSGKTYRAAGLGITSMVNSISQGNKEGFGFELITTGMAAAARSPGYGAFVDAATALTLEMIDGNNRRSDE